MKCDSKGCILILFFLLSKPRGDLSVAVECTGVSTPPPTNVHPTLGMHQWDHWLLAWISDDTQDSLLTTDYSAGGGELEAEEEIKCFFLFLQPVSGLWPDRVNEEEIRQTLSFMSANSHMLEVKRLH